MNNPDYFQCNPVYNYYENAKCPIMHKDIPYYDFFSGQIRCYKKIIPANIYISKHTKNDMSNPDNWPWPIKLEKK